jgi:S1-C subfamily serine protease
MLRGGSRLDPLGVQVESVGAPGYWNHGAAVSGALIAGVVSGGPAASAGLVAGEVITAINGHVSSPSAMSALILTKKPGATIRVAYVDLSGVNHTASVTLGTGPAQ